MELLERNIYNCEIYRIPYGIIDMKKTFIYRNETLPIGKGFFWVLKILDNGKYKDREIIDYFNIQYDWRYTNKQPNLTKLLNAMKCLKITNFKANSLFGLEGRILKVLISIKLNQNNLKENYVEDYIYCENNDFKKTFF